VFHVTLENRATGQAVRLATVKDNGKTVEICQTFDNPLSVQLTELLIGSSAADITLSGGPESRMDQALTAGELVAARDIIERVYDRCRPLKHLGHLVGQLQDEISILTGEDE